MEILHDIPENGFSFEVFKKLIPCSMLDLNELKNKLHKDFKVWLLK
jgi:hypothetical protein